MAGNFHYSPVAQLVEQAAVNRFVVGSSPTGELIRFLRNRPPHQSTPGAERSAAGRLSFWAYAYRVFRRTVAWLRALCFERELPGSESNPQGCDRTPKSLAKSLGISD